MAHAYTVTLHLSPSLRNVHDVVGKRATIEAVQGVVSALGEPIDTLAQEHIALFARHGVDSLRVRLRPDEPYPVVMVKKEIRP